MTLATADAVPDSKALRGSLPLWIGVAIYAMLVVVSGDRLLLDPDTQWQITVGKWILDHHAVPHTDVYSFTMRGQPWISTQWLAQVLYAKVYAWFGWTGPVALAALGSAATFALLARYLVRNLSDSAAVVFVAVALALTAPHLLARPHVLALPIMVVWIGELIAAADRREAPSFMLLPLMVLWANLHGGFVFGLMMVAPIALDCLIQAPPGNRVSLAMRWAVFAALAIAASCCTPYGWDSLLASRKILALGSALPLITEWRAADFTTVHPLEICLLGGVALALYRGITLPPMRIVILLGLLHMALSQGRAAELLALLSPLVLANPLARQLDGAQAASSLPWKPLRGTIVAALAVVLAGGTLGFASIHRFAPYTGNSPVQAVTELKKLKLERVFNDYDFGGYLIASGVAPFIDGRTELYGEKFFVDHNNASGLMEPENLFRLLKEYDIQVTLMRTRSAATKLLDHMDGWQKVYSDDIATIHVRKADALHTMEPLVEPAIAAGAK
ncbi:hypothetical protein [Bradyrhizobium sp.]|uniref:hypothetical protein n=1 Tax=Bradyrhizobium sp. TaxID=376 RepID=UPI00260E9B38|nr:hypothetical protein [Bradyrhizobium sp.]